MALRLLPKNIQGKILLLRVDINSAIGKGKPIDSPRFKAHGDYIMEISKRGGRIAILAHQGRKGNKDYMESLKGHSKILEKHAGIKVLYSENLFGEEANSRIMALRNGDAVLLENARNYDEDDIKGMRGKYAELCRNCDLFVNHAFSVCHRKQASIILPPKFLPSYAGENLMSELGALGKVKINSAKKAAYLLGGEKFEDYFPLFKVLENQGARILASGVLGNSFLASSGINLGYENEWLRERGYERHYPELRRILKRYKERIVLPLDFAVGSVNPEGISKRKEALIEEMPSTGKIWDVGKKTQEMFRKIISCSEAVFMKGPLGFSEIRAYSNSTRLVLRHISELTREGRIFSLLAGGHLATAVYKYKIPDNFSYKSLSGGAAILFLAGEELPGIEALK